RVRHQRVRDRVCHRRATRRHPGFPREASAAVRGPFLKIRTITFDFWGTLLLDNAPTDNRYKRRRMDDFERILADAGVPVSRRARDAAYDASGSELGRIWSTYRDVPVEHHVSTILGAAGRDILGQVDPPTMTALVDAYARPALLVPPAVDPGARAALEAL